MNSTYPNYHLSRQNAISQRYQDEQQAAQQAMAERLVLLAELDRETFGRDDLLRLALDAVRAADREPLEIRPGESEELAELEGAESDG